VWSRDIGRELLARPVALICSHAGLVDARRCALGDKQNNDEEQIHRVGAALLRASNTRWVLRSVPGAGIITTCT
jgi:hypothetical protein